MEFQLKACRINADLSLKEASDRLNVHPQTLSKYERDSTNISISLLKEIADLYHVPEDFIFLGTEYEYLCTYFGKEGVAYGSDKS